MAGERLTQTGKEVVGKGLEFGGLIGGIIGLATLNPEIVLFSAAAYVGGNWIEGSAKKGK